MITKGHLKNSSHVSGGGTKQLQNLLRRSVSCNVLLLLIIFSLSFLSVGAWWDRGKDKPKEGALKKEATAVEIIKVEAKEIEKEEPGEARLQEVGEGQKERTVVATKVVLDPEEQKKEVERLREELNDIINRTQQLQNQVKDSRSEIQGILERAQIHERILRDITLPQPVQMRYQINSDAILKHEKLRLISEQARQTQQQLRVIQQARSLEAMKSLPPDTKTSKST